MIAKTYLCSFCGFRFLFVSFLFLFVEGNGEEEEDGNVVELLTLGTNTTFGHWNHFSIWSAGEDFLEGDDAASRLLPLCYTQLNSRFEHGRCAFLGQLGCRQQV